MDEHGNIPPMENDAPNHPPYHFALYFRAKTPRHQTMPTQPPRALKSHTDVSRQAVNYLGSKFPILRNLFSASYYYRDDDYILEASMIEGRRRRLEEAEMARREALEGVRRAREMVARKVEEVNELGIVLVSRKEIEGLERLVAAKQEELRWAEENFRQEINHVFFDDDDH